MQQSSDQERSMAEAMVNQTFMSLPGLIGTHAILKYKKRKLLLYLPAVIIFLTYWRKFICARCQYYGELCATTLGIMTSRMMPRDETKDLDRNAMIVDFVYIGLLILIPLPQTFKRLRLGFLYLLSVAVGVSVMLKMGCRKCGNDFCPLKDVSNMLEGRGS